MSEKMTIEKAKETVKEFEKGSFDVGEDTYDFCCGFIEGYESRQNEIDALNAMLSWFNARLLDAEKNLEESK